MRNNSVIFFESGPVDQEDLLFKIFLILSSGDPCVLWSWNHLCNFGRGHYGLNSCEIILNLAPWFRCC